MDWAIAKAGIEATPKTVIYTILITLSPFILIALFALSQRDRPVPPPAGCRKLGVRGRGNFEDQYSKKYAKGADATKEQPWTVKALFVYPLKSAGPVELDKSEVLRTGLKYDRQFTLGQYVTSMPGLDGKVTSEWQFCTQRKFPRLAKVETEIWVPDPSAPGYKEDGEWVKSEGCLVIRFPFSQDTDFSLQGLQAWGKILAAQMAGKSEPMLEFRVPFNPSQERIKSKGYKSETLRIWKDSPVALNMGPEVDPEMLAKLKYTIGTTNPVTLFRIDTNKFREVYKCAPKKEDVGFQAAIGMQDSYPVHILNLASVHDVASKLPRDMNDVNTMWKIPTVNALRYRANIYFTGPPAFHEDNWIRTKIGSTNYHISCRTTRCKLPNVDPETGKADPNEPLTTMRKYRVIDEGSKNAVLGMQVTPLEAGEVKVGDIIEVLETGSHYFLAGEGEKVIG
ncbi:MOSC domain-containing protein [Didymella exigua CBS 183.55]|uniref:MOSC domain-containing protein n=1 Tax=Didymella exigua CBS 183.55 TaxID=1150837 RepID=A0A6A5RH65_9PLEO|nr:MOSC domain-containing protein [Didymella exigua CBS 183.55]KAF1926468.1 MOSC domain-containing protein [Didymella exigua CBS 183.55]